MIQKYSCQNICKMIGDSTKNSWQLKYLKEDVDTIMSLIKIKPRKKITSVLLSDWKFGVLMAIIVVSLDQYFKNYIPLIIYLILLTIAVLSIRYYNHTHFYADMKVITMHLIRFYTLLMIKVDTNIAYGIRFIFEPEPLNRVELMIQYINDGDIDKLIPVSLQKYEYYKEHVFEPIQKYVDDWKKNYGNIDTWEHYLTILLWKEIYGTDLLTELNKIGITW
jgi:hypothetical protein